MVEVLRTVGGVIAGPTEDLAPADRRLYALRDVTSTVDSIPLIASSIMSKKVAEGTDALVLDVKVGSGAFLPEVERARELAETMVGLGEHNGVRTVALLTATPLARNVGPPPFCPQKTSQSVDCASADDCELFWHFVEGNCFGAADHSCRTGDGSS